MYRQKGSITIFSLLSMLLVMATLLSILEMTRYQAIKSLAQLQTETAMESAFANYSTILWERYHLLACEESQLKTALSSAGETRQNDWNGRHNLLLFQNTNGKLTNYMRLTDGEGQAYIKAVATYMEKNLLYETAKEIYNQYKALKELKNNASVDLDNVDNALEEIEKEEKRQSEEKQKRVRKNSSIETNPLKEFQKLQKAGILNLVLEDTEDLSESKMDLRETVSHRERKEGTMSIEEDEEAWLNRIWLQQYFLNYMSCYGGEKKGSQLAYELEYLIGGKNSDVGNLKVVVTELLAIRTACNFVFLTSDVEKLEQANLLAIAIAGSSINIALIKAIKIGIITAWAFGESVLDVRAILDGKRIPLIKDSKLWTLELNSLGLIASREIEVKEADYGLNYKNYVGLLLLFMSEDDLAMRSMDVQEATLRKQYKDDSFAMDNLLIVAEGKVTYRYKPIFQSLEKIKEISTWKYEIICKETYGYVGR